MRPIELNAASRVLVIAPHPDDESLGCGGLILHAVAARAQVRVLSVTDGDNNPWPQRVLERRLRIGPDQRAAWGRRRRGEVLAATALLGLHQTNVVFAGLPDFGLTEQVMRGDDFLAGIVERELDTFRPTLIASPSLHDAHPDHSAAALVVRLALRERADAPLLYEYLVHGRPLYVPDEPFDVALSAGQVAAKRAAIACHRTQMVVSATRFLAYATETERFRDPAWNDLSNPVRRVSRQGGKWEAELAPRRWYNRLSRAELCLLVCDGPRIVARRRVKLFGRAGFVRPIICDSTTDSVLDRGEQVVQWPANVRVILPESLVPATGSIFIKRTGGLTIFDEAGWCETDL